MIKDNPITEKIDRADELLAQGKYGAAITLLENVHRIHPEDESALIRLAWGCWDNGDRDRSIEYWEILLDRELQRKVFTGFAYDELVRIYKQEGQIGKLVELCEKAARVQPQDIGLLEELGKAYLLAGESEKACETFEKLTSMESDNPAFYCRLGEALMSAGKTEAGEEVYRKAGDLDPEEADRYLFQAAGLYLRGGHFNSAKRLLNLCLKIVPENSLYYCSLGDIHVALNEPQNAFTHYEKACQCNRPHTASYFNRLGNALMKAGFFADAAKAFEAALSFDASTPCRQNLEKAYQAADPSPSGCANR